MTTYKQDKDFISDVIPSSLLEDCINWIRRNCSPDEVFNESVLVEWAEDNGFIYKEESE